MKKYTLKKDLLKLDKSKRLHQVDHPIIGLTGGIASGKSTAASFFKEKGLRVLDADKLIKSIYQRPEVVTKLRKLRPEAVSGDNHINFKDLRSWAFSHQDHIKTLENLLYPHMPNAFRDELRDLSPREVVIYDIPLLFEKNYQHLVDCVICVYIPKNIQMTRLLKRDGLQGGEAERVLSQQMDIDKKKALAQFVFDNSKNQEYLAEQVSRFIESNLDELRPAQSY